MVEKAIASEAARIDAAAATAETGESAGKTAAPQAGELLAPAPDFDRDARDLVDTFADSLGQMFPSTKKVYDTERRAQLATRTAHVLRVRGLSMEVILGKWAPEIMLGLSFVSTLVPASDAIVADLRAKKLAAAGDARPAQGITEPGAASSSVPTAGEPPKPPDPFAGLKI